MATVSKSEVSRQFLGSSIKMEVVQLTSTSDGDTFTSKLQNPQFVLAFNNGDASGANNISASVSSRTITVHDPDITTVICLVFGQ